MVNEDLYTTVSFDPGGTTGWFTIAVHSLAITSKDYKILDNVVTWSAGEFTGSRLSQVRQMLELVDAWPGAKIVVEQFILRQMNMDPMLLEPVAVTAAFQFGLEDRRKRRDPERPIIFQQPSLAMTTITDDRLRAIGYYERLSGLPHARDAARHGLTWLRRAKQILENHRN